LEWNMVSSYGSLVSVVAVAVFVYVIYRTLTDGNVVTANYWKSRELFEIPGETGPESTTSLEWVQTSPPSLHTYTELTYIAAATKAAR
jgi:heme/copper-type cytochrome/quinol oxidase subunit 1